MVFDAIVTFTAGGPTEQTVSADIRDDMIALENDEIVNVSLTIVSPASGVNLGYFPTTVVSIVDDDCKFSMVRQGLFYLEYIKICIFFGFLALSAYFTELEVAVNESDRMVEICVEKSLQTIPDVVFGLQSRDGSATGNTMQFTTQATLNYKSLLPLLSRWPGL